MRQPPATGALLLNIQLYHVLPSRKKKKKRGQPALRRPSKHWLAGFLGNDSQILLRLNRRVGVLKSRLPPYFFLVCVSLLGIGRCCKIIVRESRIRVDDVSPVGA